MKLFNLKSKSAIKSNLYGLILPLERGLKRDTAWEGIHNIFKAMNENGLNMELSKVNNDHYKIEGGSKVYHFTMEFHTTYNKVAVIGKLTAMSAGTVEYPWDAYDITTQIDEVKFI